MGKGRTRRPWLAARGLRWNRYEVGMRVPRDSGHSANVQEETRRSVIVRVPCCTTSFVITSDKVSQTSTGDIDCWDVYILHRR